MSRNTNNHSSDGQNMSADDSLSEKDVVVDCVLDAAGLLCPEPVMLLHNAVTNANEGDVIKIIATDPSTKRDIAKFCVFLGHTLLRQEDRGDQYLFFVEVSLSTS